MAKKKKKITGMIPRFGANRINAESVGKLIGKRKFILVAFAGSLTECRHLQAPSIVVNDVDLSVINLGRVNQKQSAELIKALDKTIFHPSELYTSQKFCEEMANRTERRDVEDPPYNFTWAYRYFIAAWMGRNDACGTEKEFDAGYSSRNNGNGGDSCKRFRSATEALIEWEQASRNWNFRCEDALTLIPKIEDSWDNAIYADPPWPDDGDVYKHKFGEAQHREMAKLLGSLKKTRVVVRLGEHPLVTELYPEHKWVWHRCESRTQGNNPKKEVLLCRN